MHMMAESSVPHHSETTKVPNPFETEALTTIEITPHTNIKAPAINNTDATLSIETRVIFLTSAEPCVHLYGGPNDCFLGVIDD